MPLQPVDPIIYLHADFAKSDRLGPSRTANEIVIEALCARDREHLRQIKWLQARGARRPLINAARGPWRYDDGADDRYNSNEREALAQLHQRNYFEQALVYYAELGPAAEHLSLPCHEALIEGAAARGELEGTLSLFGRLEEHPQYRPGWRSHVALIHLYAKQEKSSELVKDIFESYLKSRAKGDIKVPARELFRRTWLSPKPIRHSSSTEPVFRTQPLNYYNNGDEEVWNETIRALVSLGDMAGAVDVVEKLIKALRSKRGTQVGYSRVIGPEVWGALAAGFAVRGDHASAMAWFDNLVSGTAPAVVDPRGRLPSTALLTALQTDDVAFVNHVYRHMLAHASRAPLLSSQLAQVVDYNLAQANKAEDPAVRNALFDTVLEFRHVFRQVANDGLENGVEIGRDRSTGFLGRMAATMGSFGRFEEATSTFVVLAKIVCRIMQGSGNARNAGRQNSFAWKRSNRNWARALTDEASGTLGFVPIARNDTKDKTMHGLKRLVAERPSLRQAVTVVGWTNEIRNLDDLAPLADHVLTVAAAYSAARTGVGREDELGQLRGGDWRVVLECMAYTAAFIGRGIVVDFDSAGFDAALDDFLASGTYLPRVDPAAILESLKVAGVSKGRIDEVASLLRQRVAQAPVKVMRQPPLQPATEPSERNVGDAVKVDPTPPAADRYDKSPVETRDSPSAEAYEAKIAKVDVTGGDARAAVTIFEVCLRLGIRPTASLFNTLLLKLAKARQVKQAFDYFELMKQHGVRPTALTYGLVISMCCNVGDDSTATFLFNDMRATPGFQPRAAPYNAMMHFYTCTKPDRERAFYYWECFQRDGVEPTAETYLYLLDAYGSFAPPDLEQTQRVFTQLVQAEGITVNAEHWASLITAYGVFGKDVERALAIFESIKDHATTLENPDSRLPDAEVYVALLCACTANGRYDLVDQFLDRMRKEGVQVAAPLADELLKTLVDNRSYELVDRYLDRMRSDGISLSPGVAEAILRSCIAENQLDLVDHYLDRMQSDNVRMPPPLVEHVLHACIVGGRPELIEHYLERLRKDGVRMSSRAAYSLIESCAERGAIEQARHVFEAIGNPPAPVCQKKESSKPAPRDSSTFELMLRCELAADAPFKAIEVYNRAQELDFPSAAVARLREMLEEAGIQLLSLD
ncbi:hypothetical protein JCM10295v2_002663 [Rhodotorula toruloides]